MASAKTSGSEDVDRVAGKEALHEVAERGQTATDEYDRQLNHGFWLAY